MDFKKPKKMKKIKKYFWIIIGIIILVYIIGPKPPKPKLNNDLPVTTGTLLTLEKTIKDNESELPVKPDNESRIHWVNDSIKERTEYCLLYLHGFSASWYEGYPANMEFAERYKMNAYFPRLASHGLVTEDALIDMTPERLWESAKEALMTARQLGKKVIIMSTSTGGTLSLKLASEFPEYIDGLILYSPNIKLKNPAAILLSKPWGLQLGRKINGGKYRITNEDFSSKDCSYWNCKYRVESLVYLQQLIDATMKKEVFKNVSVPVFLGYYYKDKENQDQTVDVKAIQKMYLQLGTPEDKKTEQAFPEAGNHIIACELFSGSVDEVMDATFLFAEKILLLEPLI